MPRKLTVSELEAYLDEALEPSQMADVERELRAQPELLQRLAEINSRRDAGVHTLGEIWRRHRVSCPTRDQLGSFLLGALHGDQAEYVQFHIETIGCRYCLANFEDLKRRHGEAAEATSKRRTRYFQSSAGYLQKKPKKK